MKLLVHLDINVQPADQEDLVHTVERIKEHVRKEVLVTYNIQIETRKHRHRKRQAGHSSSYRWHANNIVDF